MGRTPLPLNPIQVPSEIRQHFLFAEQRLVPLSPNSDGRRRGYFIPVICPSCSNKRDVDVRIIKRILRRHRKGIKAYLARCDGCARRAKGEYRPLLSSEVPEHLRSYIRFDRQEKQSYGHYIILVQCPDCGDERWLSRSATREQIQRGKFTGRCVRCAAKHKIQKYKFGLHEAIRVQETAQVGPWQFGDQYRYILEPMARELSAGRINISRAILAIKIGRPLINRVSGLAYWEVAHHTSYSTLLDGSNLELRVVQRDGRSNHAPGGSVPEPMGILLAENAILWAMYRRMEQRVAAEIA